MEKYRAVGIKPTADIGVICHNCSKLLYEAPLLDNTTRIVALLTADGHSKSFSENHRVSIFKGFGRAATTREVFSTVPGKTKVFIFSSP